MPQPRDPVREGLAHGWAAHRGTVDASARPTQGGRHHSARRHALQRRRPQAAGRWVAQSSASSAGRKSRLSTNAAAPQASTSEGRRAGSLTETRTTVGRGYAAVMRRAVSMPSMPPMVTSSSTRLGSRSSNRAERRFAGVGLSDRHEPGSGCDHGARRSPERGAVVDDQHAHRSVLESGFTAHCRHGRFCLRHPAKPIASGPFAQAPIGRIPSQWGPPVWGRGWAPVCGGASDGRILF